MEMWQENAVAHLVDCAGTSLIKLPLKISLLYSYFWYCASAWSKRRQSVIKWKNVRMACCVCHWPFCI